MIQAICNSKSIFFRGDESKKGKEIAKITTAKIEEDFLSLYGDEYIPFKSLIAHDKRVPYNFKENEKFLESYKNTPFKNFIENSGTVIKHMFYLFKYKITKNLKTHK